MIVNPVLARVVRSGVVESVHRGQVVVTDPDGNVEFVLGGIDVPTFPRSALKPLQAIAMLDSGLDLSGELLALAAASHGGEEMHLAGVRQILEGAGLEPSDLQNTPDYPTDELARADWIVGGHGKESLAQNCSGKHAAMLRTCVRAGWPIESYLEPDHPLQVTIAKLIGEYVKRDVTHGVDGCGAPAFVTTMRELAQIFGRLAAATEGHAHWVAEAYRHHPEFMSGTRKLEAKLMRAVPGLFCKGGAESVFAFGLPNGQGISIKLDDGHERALPVLAVEVLGYLGIRSEALTRIGEVPVLGHGRPVGEIIATLTPEG